jgi:hypothetical protein
LRQPAARHPPRPRLSTRFADCGTEQEDLQFLDEQINEYNFTATGIRDARLLLTLLRDSAGPI